MIGESVTWGELAQAEPMARLALQRYGLVDVGDDVPVVGLLNASCKQPGFVLRVLELYSDQHTFRAAEFSGFSLSAILEYLQLTHRFYEERFLPKMDMCIEAIKRNFPEHPIAPVLDTFFRSYRNELLEHIELEEKKLFPYASSLYDGSCTFDYSVKEFKLQHDHHVDDELGKMLHMVESDFPAIAESMSYRAFRHLLEQFETDLFVHHLIEERVFVPRVHELELEAAKHLYS